VKRLALILFACIALVAATGCGGDDDSSSPNKPGASSGATGTESSSDSSSAESESSGEDKTKPKVKVPDGPPPKELKIKEIEEGSGAKAQIGDEVTVQYVGVGYKSKEEFDSSWSRNEPFTFGLGAGQVITGWDQGVEGMKVGGRRELIIPPQLAYGAASPSPEIGPNETLIFVIDLVAVN
jgi:peptidylprolyl isomerase